MTAFIVLFITLSGVSAALSAGEDKGVLRDWVIREFKAPVDLPNDAVRDVIMARDGSVWMASWGGGAVRLAGARRQFFRARDGLVSDNVRAVKEDIRGWIWVATADGISCIAKGKIYNFSSKTVPVIPYDSFYSIESLGNGEVWFGGGQGHLIAWSPGENPSDPGAGSWRIIHHFTGAYSISVRKIVHSGENSLLLAVDQVGMMVFDTNIRSATFYLHEIPENKYFLPECKAFATPTPDTLFYISWNYIAEVKDHRLVDTWWTPAEALCIQQAFGTVFVGTQKGLYSWKNHQWTFCPLTPDQRNLPVESISLLPDESLWIGTRSGAFRLSKPAWVSPDLSPGGPVIYGETLLRNPENELLVTGTEGHAWKYSQKQWRYFHQFPFHFFPYTTNYLYWAGGKLILNRNAEYDVYDLAALVNTEHLVLPPLADIGRKNHVFLSENQVLWFPCQKGIAKWDGSQYVIVVPISRADNTEVYSILQTAPGEYWIGGKGWIEHWQDGTGVNVELPEGFLDKKSPILDSLQTRSGALWFSQLGRGLLCFKDGEWRQENLETGLPSNYIWSLFEASDGTIWAGDRTNGVMSYQDGRWIQYGFEDGLPLGPVVSIVEDDQNAIWIGVEKGGIYQFQPDRDPPAVDILSTPDRLVPDAQGVFSFQGHDAWNVTRREDLVYSWRVRNARTEQPVTDWSPYAPDTSVTVPPLRPGRYVFEVLAQDTHRNISPAPARAVFDVIPYFWMTYQFQIPAALACGFALLSLFLWRERYVMKLRAERIGFREFCEATRIGVMRLSPAGELSFVNAAMARIAGYASPEEMLSVPHPVQWINQAAYQRFLDSLRGLQSAPPITLKGRRFTTGQPFYVLLYGLVKEDAIELMALDLTEQRQLEQEIALASTREQQKLGNDLHDTVVQDLIAASYMAQMFLDKLSRAGHADFAELKTLIGHLDETRRKTHQLTQGLLPIARGELGFQSALQDLTAAIESCYGVRCWFTPDRSIAITDDEAELHLYYIAHEALHNAVKHARANSITLDLRRDNGAIVLSVHDDGVGLSAPASREGLGMHIMKYRAGLILAELNIYNHPEGGAVVECRYPIE
ncbi:MAG: two-component regulator propeller domain-containing protein [bacterium]